MSKRAAAVDGVQPGWHVVRVNDQSFPVTVLVTHPDGSKEQVRVGTAVRTGDGFSLSLGELSIGAVADAPAARRTTSAAPAGASANGGMVFPPYGRSKGQPILGASSNDLEFYMNGCRRTLDDPGKARWHEKERVLLAAIEAEIARQQGDDGAFSGGGGGGGGGRAASVDYDDGPPAHSDDDIPF